MLCLSAETETPVEFPKVAAIRELGVYASVSRTARKPSSDGKISPNSELESRKINPKKMPIA